MDTDRRPHPDDPQLLDRGATERRVQYGRHRGACRESPARPGHHADQNLVPEGARFDPKNADPTSATGASLPDAFLRPIQFTNVTERTREGVTDYDSCR